MESTDGIYAISVAARMTSMNIQNLRVYERHGLLEPERSTGGTRLYSDHDVRILHRIGELLALGLNLVGISYVLRLEGEVARLEARLEQLSHQPASTPSR